MKFEKLQAQCLICFNELKTVQKALLVELKRKQLRELHEYAGTSAQSDICPTCGLPSRHKANRR